MSLLHPGAVTTRELHWCRLAWWDCGSVSPSGVALSSLAMMLHIQIYHMMGRSHTKLQSPLWLHGPQGIYLTVHRHTALPRGLLSDPGSRGFWEISTNFLRAQGNCGRRGQTPWDKSHI